MQRIPYLRFPKNISRPCLYIVLENPEEMQRRTNPVPMIVDTGSDFCIFNAELAHEIGINPTEGGQLERIWVAGGGMATVAAWPVSIYVPQLSVRFSLMARFGQFSDDINGLLGHKGFLRWMDITFSFDEEFCVNEIRSKPPVGGIPAPNG